MTGMTKEQIQQDIKNLIAELNNLVDLSKATPPNCEELDTQIEQIKHTLDKHTFKCAIPQFQDLGCPDTDK